MGTGQSITITTDGVRLAGDRWGAGTPTIVLLHAGVCDRRSWYEVAEEIAGSGTVVAYDRRGFGGSAPSPDPFTHQHDLVAVLDQVAEGPVWLVGSSMGGELALELALSAPERVEGLILLAPGIPDAPEEGELDDASAGLFVAIETATKAGELEQANRLEILVWLDGPAGPEGRVAGPARTLALSMNRIVLDNDVDEAAGASGAPLWDRLAEIAIPTVVACGELDLPVLVDECDRLARRIPGARSVTLPGVAHLPYLEDPATVANLIKTALG